MSGKYEEKELARLIAVALEKSKKISLKKLTETLLNVQCVDDVKSYTILRYIIDTASEEFGISKDDLMGAGRTHEIALCKRISILMAIKYTNFKDKKIAFEFDTSRQFVHRVKKEFNTMERGKKSSDWYFDKYDKLNDKINQFVKGLDDEIIKVENK